MPPIIARSAARVPHLINLIHPTPFRTAPISQIHQAPRRTFQSSPPLRAFATPQQPPPPSRFGRSRYLAYLLTGIVIGGTTHIYSMHDFIKYTDSETLDLFKPGNAHETEINDFINQHPIAVALRQNAAYTESRPTLKVKEEHRNASLTSGILSGAGRIVVPPVVWVEENGKSLVALMYLGDEICGYPGLIHGGVLATLLDEGLARASFAALPNGLAMTASLSIQYRKPSPANSYVVLRAETEKVEGRKAWVKGRIETLPKEEGVEPVVLVEAEALFIEPRNAQNLTKLVGKP